MSDSVNYSLFIIASWALIVTPGPDVIYVITRGIAQGRRAGIISAAGVTTGILFHTLFAAFGLSLILRTSAVVFMFVKLSGAVYLIYLGLKVFKDKRAFKPLSSPEGLSQNKLYIQGVMSNVLNPKVALFFLAFLPQFIVPAYGNVTFQIILLGLSFAFFCIIFLIIVGYFAGKIGIWLSANAFFRQAIRWISGSIMILLGLRLAISGNK